MHVDDIIPYLMSFISSKSKAEQSRADKEKRWECEVWREGGKDECHRAA